MIKLFIEVNIDCAAMERGREDIVTIVNTDAEPSEIAMGTPRNISSRKTTNNVILITICCHLSFSSVSFSFFLFPAIAIFP